MASPFGFESLKLIESSEIEKKIDYLLNSRNKYGSDLYFPIKLEFYKDIINNKEVYKIVMLKTIASRLSYDNEELDKLMEYKEIITLISSNLNELYKSTITLLEQLR